MWPWTRREITPVGFEIVGAAVRLVQVRFRANDRPTARVSHRPVRSSHAAADWVAQVRAGARTARQMLAEGGFEGRRVVTCLPDHLLHLRTLRLPSGSAIPLDELVRREAQPLFPFKLDEARLQYIKAGHTRYGQEVRDEVIVAASAKRDVDAFLAELDRAGLDVSAMDLSPCAAYRAARWRSEAGEQIHAVLHVGAIASHVVVGKDENLRFLKRVSVGTDELNSAVSRRLGIDAHDAAQVRRRVDSGARDPSSERDTIRRNVWQACRSTLEALAAEVSTCLRYYGVAFRGPRPDRLLISGAEATSTQLCSILSSAVLPGTRGASPLASFDAIQAASAERGSELGGEWSVAVGLALKTAAPSLRPSPDSPVPLSAERSAALVTASPL